MPTAHRPEPALGDSLSRSLAAAGSALAAGTQALTQAQADTFAAATILGMPETTLERWSNEMEAARG